MSILTWYTAALTAVLFCGGTYGGQAEPFLALPVDGFGSEWQCGDRIRIEGNGWTLNARALDAGPLHLYYIRDWPDLRIAADIPARFALFHGLSAKARVVNLSALARRRGQRGKRR